MRAHAVQSALILLTQTHTHFLLVVKKKYNRKERVKVSKSRRIG